MSAPAPQFPHIWLVLMGCELITKLEINESVRILSFAIIRL